MARHFEDIHHIEAINNEDFHKINDLRCIELEGDIYTMRLKRTDFPQTNLSDLQKQMELFMQEAEQSTEIVFTDKLSDAEYASISFTKASLPQGMPNIF